METNSDGLGIYPNMRYATHPRLVDHFKNKVQVVRTHDNARVMFADPIYENSPFYLAMSFSTDFTDAEILASCEVESWLMGITGYSLVTRWEPRG